MPRPSSSHHPEVTPPAVTCGHGFWLDRADPPLEPPSAPLLHDATLEYYFWFTGLVVVPSLFFFAVFGAVLFFLKWAFSHVKRHATRRGD